MLNLGEGVITFIENQSNDVYSAKIKRWANSFMDKITCEVCNGSRLNKQADYFKINNKTIHDLSTMDIVDLKKWFKNINTKLDNRKKIIGSEIIKEINKRLDFLLDVGLNYLSLTRPVKSLSGGESQRIRLATQIGSQLVGVLYILDEPSIGLHQKDNSKLIESLKKLRDLGNTIIVVDHTVINTVAMETIVTVRQVVLPNQVIEGTNVSKDNQNNLFGLVLATLSTTKDFYV